MRFLHTSDWHLGRTFNTRSRYDEQVAFLDWFIEAARVHAVDGVFIAGDVYDRAAPSEESIALLDDALQRLVEVCPVVLISGNHDSAHRLAYGGWAFESAGLHVRSSLEMVEVPVSFRDGDHEVLVYGIHYLDPDQSHRPLDAGRTHSGVLEAAMNKIRADLATRSDARSVVLAHAFIAGGLESESERQISVGGAAQAPVGIFAGIDYLALGHLHRPQQVSSGAGLPVAHYSGSPLAYSFSEEHEKSVLLVNVPALGAVTVEQIPIPVGRPVVTITAPLDELLGEAHARHRESWVRAYYTDPQRIEDAYGRLERAFPFLLACERKAAGVDASDRGGHYIDPARALPIEVLTAFVQDVSDDGLRPEDVDYLSDVLEAVQRKADVS